MPCTALNLFCLCLDRLCLMFYYSSLSFERRPLNLSIKLNMNLSRLSLFSRPKEIKMEMFNKELKYTDIQFQFSFPSRSLHYLDFAGGNFVDLKVKDREGI